LAVGADQTHLWDLSADPPAERWALKGHTFGVRGVAFSPDGQFLATGGHDKLVRVWDLRGAAPVELPAPHVHTEGINAVAYSPDGKLFASAGYDKSVVLWEVTGDQVKERGVLKIDDKQSRAIFSLAVSPNGRLATGGEHGLWQLWDTGRRLPLQRNIFRVQHGDHLPVAFTPDGKTLALGTDNGIR